MLYSPLSHALKANSHIWMGWGGLVISSSLLFNVLGRLVSAVCLYFAFFSLSIHVQLSRVLLLFYPFLLLIWSRCICTSKAQVRWDQSWSMHTSFSLSRFYYFRDANSSKDNSIQGNNQDRLRMWYGFQADDRHGYGRLGSGKYVHLKPRKKKKTDTRTLTCSSAAMFISSCQQGGHMLGRTIWGIAEPYTTFMWFCCERMKINGIQCVSFLKYIYIVFMWSYWH